MVIKTASPGVFVQEVDLTRGVADPVTRNVGVVAGPFKKGPVDQLVYVTEEVEFQRIFGGPTDENYEYWWSVNNFLEYSGNCYVVRCDDSQGDAVDAGANIVHPQTMRNATDSYYYFADKTNPEDLSQDGLEAQSDVYMKNADEFTANVLEKNVIYTGSNGSIPKFLSRNPGMWAEGLAVAVIDKGADYQFTLKSQASTTGLENVNIHWGGTSTTDFPADIDGGDVNVNPTDEINGGTASQTGQQDVTNTMVASGIRPVFNSDLARGTSIAKYGKIIVDDTAYAALTTENEKEQYLVDIVGSELVRTVLRIGTSVGVVVKAEDLTEGDVSRVVYTLSFVKLADGTYGDVFDGTAEGDAVVNVTTSLSIGTVVQAYELGDIQFYSKTSNQVVNAIFKPKTYNRDEGIGWLWPNRPFDGEKVYNGKVAVDLQGAPVIDLDGNEVTLQGPAVVASVTEDTITWNARREVWEVNYVPQINDIIYDGGVDELGNVPTIYQIGRVSDWYSQQIAFEGMPWRSFGPRPGTSANAQDFNCFDDEMHVIVYDAYGEVTGQKGSTIEQHILVSKLKGAKTVEGSNNYYKDVINRESEVLFSNAPLETIEGELNFDKVDPGTVISTGITCKLLAPRYGTVTRDKVIAAATNTTDGSTENFPYLLIGSNDQLTASLGEVQAGYEKVVEENIADLDYIIQGPGYDPTIFAGSTLSEQVAASVGKANYLIALGERLKTAMVLISPPRCSSLEPINAGEITKRIIQWAEQISSSSYAVMDSGYKYMYDRFSDKYRYVPLNADIAGTMAQTTQFSEPFFSPAGMVRGQIRSLVKLGFDPSKDQRDQLFSSRVNSVVSFPGEGTVLYGDKTALGYASAFSRINVRRLFIYAEREISKIAKSVLFEFNDTPTRVNFKNTVDPFLRDIVSKRGAIDFLVVCDTSNNTPEVIDRNEFIADIYIKPNRSINFVQLSFVATKTGVSFSEAVGANRRGNTIDN